MSELLERRTVTMEVDDSLTLGMSPFEYIQKGNVVIASEDGETMKRYMNWVERISLIPLPRAARVAHIGAGTCVMPRMLNVRPWGAVDIYELEPAIVGKMARRYAHMGWRWVTGNYRDTLDGRYDLIIYDLLEPPDRALLEAHLADNGTVIEES